MPTPPSSRAAIVVIAVSAGLAAVGSIVALGMDAPRTPTHAQVAPAPQPKPPAPAPVEQPTPPQPAPPA
jgi:hypothetical protein